MGVTHPWLTQATDWCWRLESGFDEDAHALAEVLVFLAQVPDRGSGKVRQCHVGSWLAKAQWYPADPADPAYGVTPLHLASSPDSPWPRLFDDTTIESHLDRLPGTKGQTAAGPSPGNHRGPPPPWSGAGSKSSVPYVPSSPTVGSERPTSGARVSASSTSGSDAANSLVRRLVRYRLPGGPSPCRLSQALRPSARTP